MCIRDRHIPYVALDIDPSRVLEAAAAGENVMFGDAARRVVLEAAGGARAKALVISYADNRAAMKILHIVQESYPHLPVIVLSLIHIFLFQLVFLDSFWHCSVLTP